ncbi:hypothetical protein ACXLPV_000358 [Vibrio parahaemolyticus]|uniref:hypothetical protein n=1 Tax=Vibrio sp. 2CM40D TaxID=2929855 RepID=UPI0020C01CFA|nr:hypothetical protein [Vibrio sp. 2CM40D]MCK8111364.1 hypothetical protein [Vibrio sp. 2CM40D]
MSEVKLTKKMWLFSTIASGALGVGVVDFAKFSYSKFSKNNFELELVDVWCRDKECVLTIRNKGDEEGVLTAFSIDYGEVRGRYEQFKTTHPVISSSTKSELLTTSSAAYLPKKSFADIVFGNPPDEYPTKEICLYSQSKKWCFKGAELSNIINKKV